MKCISIQQPWASSIFHPATLKDIENRSQYSRHRGPLLIHAAATPYWMRRLSGYRNCIHRGTPHRNQFDVCMLSKSQCVSPFVRMLEPIGDYRALPIGAIIGRVTMTGCVRPHATDSRWATGPWCYEIEKPERLVCPVEYNGRLGLYDVPDETIAGGEWEVIR